MKKRKVFPAFRKVFPLMILFASLLMSVGYATINSILIDISGTAIAKEVSGIYITEIDYVSNVDADIANSDILNAYQTNLSSKIVLSSTNSFSSITYTINIINTTEKNVVFNGVEYLAENYSNNNITYTLNGLNINDELVAGQSIQFTITFHYLNSTLATNNVLESIINFDFSEKSSNALKDLIIAHNTVITTTPTLTTSSNNSPNEPSGLYVSTDTNTNEPTYYFRGDVTNNNIKFAGLDWKIVRINEDGSVRLISTSYIYTRVQDATNGIDYMYYSYNIPDHLGIASNEAKAEMDNWYTTNIENTGFDSYVVTGKFCEQAKVKRASNYTGGNTEMILYTDYVPNFRCETDGNGYGELNLKVGLMTYDEVIFAGGYYFKDNDSFYLKKLYNESTYRYMGIMSPSGMSGSSATVWYWDRDGAVLSTTSNYKSYFFPVVNIDGTLQATGTGETGSEYEIVIN